MENNFITVPGVVKSLRRRNEANTSHRNTPMGNTTLHTLSCLYNLIRRRTMTNDEAIEILRSLWKEQSNEEYPIKNSMEAIDLAISALEGIWERGSERECGHFISDILSFCPMCRELSKLRKENEKLKRENRLLASRNGRLEIIGRDTDKMNDKLQAELTAIRERLKEMTLAWKGACSFEKEYFLELAAIRSRLDVEKLECGMRGFSIIKYRSAVEAGSTELAKAIRKYVLEE